MRVSALKIKFFFFLRVQIKSRPLKFLFVLVSSSRADGVMRTMNTEKLMQTLPHIQNQLDALLDFQVHYVKDRAAGAAAAAECPRSLLLLCVQPNSNELTNGVINSAFMLLFKDSIRLFAAYNEGVINMLGEPFTCTL